MTARRTFFLGILFVLLCFGYYATVYWEKHREQKARERERLFNYVPEDFSKISIQQEQQPPVIASRDESGTWHIESPFAVDAYQDLWNRVATQLAGLSSQRILQEEPSDLARYELDVPRLTVEAETRTGEKLKVTFGMPGPTRKNRYAQVNDKTLLLVLEETFFELNRGLDLLRDFRLIPRGEKEAVRLEFARYWQGNERGAAESGIEKGRESVVVVVERKPSGTWELVEPIQAIADTEAVTRLLQRMGSETCKDFIDQPATLADYGLDPPRCRITVFFNGEGEGRTIFFGGVAREGKDARIFAKRADRTAVFTVSRDFEKLFPASPTALRQRLMLSRKASDIVSIRFSSPHDTFVLKNDAEKGWILSVPQVQYTDQVAVSTLIAHLADIEATSFPEKSLADTGLDSPAATITLEYKDVPEPGVIRIGKPVAETGLWYATQDTGTIVTLSGEIAENLANLTSFMFVGKYLLQFKPQDARRLVMRFEGRDYEFTKAATIWRVVKPEGHVWESQSAMSVLLESLRAVRAEGIAELNQPTDMAPFGLDAPLLHVSVEVDPDNTGKTQSLPGLKVGALEKDASSRNRFAVVDNRPELFLVRQDLIDDIRTALKSIVPISTR